MRVLLCVSVGDIHHWCILLAAAHVVTVSRTVQSLPHHDLDVFTATFSTHLLTKGLLSDHVLVVVVGRLLNGQPQ